MSRPFSCSSSLLLMVPGSFARASFVACFIEIACFLAVVAGAPKARAAVKNPNSAMLLTIFIIWFFTFLLFDAENGIGNHGEVVSVAGSQAPEFGWLQSPWA